VILLTTLILLAAPGDVTPEQVDDWLVSYSAQRSTETYPYDDLIRDVRRVVDCETGHYDPNVLNNRKRGSHGEIGAFQFMPGARSIYYASEAAQAGWPMTDQEANVAAGVDLISKGYARHWTCF
jgi:hypothetical protein